MTKSPTNPLDFGKPGAPDELIAAVRQFIHDYPFTKAKDPRNPHEYVIKAKAFGAGYGLEYLRLLALVRDFGLPRRWHGHGPYIGIDLDDYSYWYMGDDLIVNRKLTDQAGWDLM